MENSKFYIKNCALNAISTGLRANSLTELRDKLAVVDEGCIYYHFWGERLKPQHAHAQHHNEFSSWAFHRLHDEVLAERLSIIDPTEFEDLEALRQEVLSTVEERLDESEVIHWTKREDRFHFINYSIIIFESTFIISSPEELGRAITLLPPNSIFYHFIDARSRTPDKMDDFSSWLRMFGPRYDPLIEKIQCIDPYFLRLTDLRSELAHVIQSHLEKGEQS